MSKGTAGLIKDKEYTDGKITALRGNTIKIGGDAEDPDESIKSYIDSQHPDVTAYDYKRIGELLNGCGVMYSRAGTYTLNPMIPSIITSADTKLALEVFNSNTLNCIFGVYTNKTIETMQNFQLDMRFTGTTGGVIISFRFNKVSTGIYTITYIFASQITATYTINESTIYPCCYLNIDGIPDGLVINISGFDTSNALDQFIALNPNALADNIYASDLCMQFCLAIMSGVIIKRKIVHSLEEKQWDY
jgi:hypothetical protein